MFSKDEVVELHQSLFRLACGLKNSVNSDIDLRRYVEHDVRPEHRHRNATQHKDSIYLLMEAIEVIIDDKDEGPAAKRCPDCNAPMWTGHFVKKDGSTGRKVTGCVKCAADQQRGG